MDHEHLEEALENFDNRVKNHGLEHAQAALRQRRPDVAEEIIAEFHRRVGVPLRNQRGLVGDDVAPWYMPKGDADSPRWAYAKSKLNLPPEVVKRTSDTADEIVARLGNPRSQDITTRGLVLGYVQSGKTTSFLSVAAKAVDSGYDLVIVLAGVHNSLRRQTQDRAARTLVHRSDLWWLGTAVGDFRPDGNTLSSHLAGNGKRGLLVVKKHSTILKRLANWLEREDDAALRRLAVLVIDDEADQAGLDVSPGDELEGVHKQLFRIVNLRTSDGHRRCAYLAYTATPYANILTSQDTYGLYPRDFIYPLEKPDSYVGSQELFGDQRIGDPVQIEEDDGVGDLLTSGLQDAIRWFVLATAARASLETTLSAFHSSMLIHTTQSTQEQLAYRPAVERFLALLHLEFGTDPSIMRSYYERTLEQVPARPAGLAGFLDERTASWEEVAPHVPAVLARLLERTPAGEPFKEDGRTQRAHSGVIVDNSKVDHADRLTYSNLAAGQPSVTVIAIGGNTLSRGLTLEGLVCSYFARTSRTYDSLMQMGRWYGFRPGYRHLLRVWTTQGLFDWFQELDQVEQDLRRELIWMQEKGLRPDRYGPRIRTSPNMNITRAAAMRSVSKDISYSDRVIDPAWLDLDPDVLVANQAAARALAHGLGVYEPVGDSKLFRGVALDRILAFLAAFQFHKEEKRLDKPSLESYIEKERAKLEHWNVVFKSTSRGAASTFNYFGDVGEVGTATRGRVPHASVALIQSVVDSSDHRIDFGVDPDDAEAKYRGSSEPPLMVVYAIDALSAPSAGSKRAALAASTAPITVALALPRSTSFVQYVTPVVAEIEASVAQMDLEDYHNG